MITLLTIEEVRHITFNAILQKNEKAKKEYEDIMKSIISNAEKGFREHFRRVPKNQMLEEDTIILFQLQGYYVFTGAIDEYHGYTFRWLNK